jgi:hypothetical protein
MVVAGREAHKETWGPGLGLQKKSRWGRFGQRRCGGTTEAWGELTGRWWGRDNMVPVILDGCYGDAIFKLKTTFSASLVLLALR